MASEEESPGKDWGSVSPLPARQTRRNQGSWRDAPNLGLPGQGSRVHMGFIVHLPEMHLLHGMLDVM